MRDHQPLTGDRVCVRDGGRNRHWDIHTDVVVVGLGAAGGGAAIEARTRGAEVLVVDRFGGGGATTRSAGAIYFGGGTELQRAFGYEDSPENMFNYLALEVGDAVPAATLRAFCESSVEHFEWLRALGCPFPKSGEVVKAALPPHDATLYFSGNEKCPPYCDAAVPAPRGHRPLGHSLTGHLAAKALRAGTVDAGATVKTYTRAERLVVDSDGAVIGVVVCELPRLAVPVVEGLQEGVHNSAAVSAKVSDGMVDALRAVERRAKRRYVHARGGVVLAAGGFVFDPEMMADHAPDYARCSLRLGTAGDDGTGIRMGRAVGAAWGQMDRCTAPRFIDPPSVWLRGVLVSDRGQRLCNETLYGGKVGDYIVKRADGKATLIVDARMMATGRDQIHTAGHYIYQVVFGNLNAYVTAKSAPTLRGLAAKFGIEPDPLQATIADYNAGVRAGIDALGKSREHLDAIQDAPFWGIPLDNTSRLYPSPVMTLGGLITQGASSAVTREDGSIIEGLYAAGRTAAGVASNGYASGLSVSDGLFSGRNAGRHAASRVSHSTHVTSATATGTAR